MGCRKFVGKARLSTSTGMCRKSLEIMGCVHGLPRVLAVDFQQEVAYLVLLHFKCACDLVIFDVMNALL